MLQHESVLGSKDCQEEEKLQKRTWATADQHSHTEGMTAAEFHCR